METITTTYVGDLRTEAVHKASGNTLITDAPTDNQGKGEAFSPTDLLAASLGSCMLTIMGIAARTHGFSLEGTRARITKIMQSSPRRVGGIVIEFDFPAVNYSEKQKTILEHAARTCPVALSLHPDLEQSIKFNYQ
ncbi:MAG: OsmC family protein [Bacteroidota bacterium]